MKIKLAEETSKIRSSFCESCDLVARELNTSGGNLVMFFLEPLCNMERLEFSVIKPLLNEIIRFTPDAEGLSKIITVSAPPEACDDYEKFISAIAEGDLGLIFEGGAEYILLKMKKVPLRGVEEPPTATVIKGPREGFTEDIKTNVSLLRRRLKTSKLTFLKMQIGRYSETTVMITYINGIASPDLVLAIKQRLEGIDIDGIMDSSYLTKFLESKQYSIFKQVGNDEKPDIIASKLLEGRVGVLVDCSPIVLTMPFLLIEDFIDSQDYYKRPLRATALRFIRLFAVFFAMLLPALFVALQMHQFQLLPLKLLITILNAVEGIPFSPVLEMLIALLLFEILGEASIRMPRYVGMALSVVGALVLSETAVSAGIFSSLTILITALSGIGLYAVPDEVGVLSLLRMLLVIVAGSLGIFGLMLGIVCLVAYLVTLDVYGVPYLAPLIPVVPNDLSDSIIKLSISDSRFRPFSLNNKNKVRQK